MSQPSQEQQAIQPPADDRLGVLTATAYVMQQAQYLTLDMQATQVLAERWANEPWPEQAGLDALHFCFWGEPGQPRWQIEWHDQLLDGYYALAAALSRTIEAGRPLWDAGYLANMTEEELADILRPVSGCPEIPLFAARLANAREVGRVLLERYEGQFTRAVESAQQSAVSLALLLAREFSSFHDVAEWHGQPVPFLKRAQICVADLNAAFQGQHWGAFTDLDQLTAFADYKLPQLLRRYGVLVYSGELAAQVDQMQPIAPGSEQEIEIRAATIWGVEWLRRALAERGIVRPASAIDYRLWADSQTATPDMRPYHRTRTIYY